MAVIRTNAVTKTTIAQGGSCHATTPTVPDVGDHSKFAFCDHAISRSAIIEIRGGLGPLAGSSRLAAPPFFVS